MSYVAIAGMAISAGAGVGTSIYAGNQAKKAAQNAATAQGDMYNRAIQTTQEGKEQALNYLDPFRQYGLNAGVSLQDALYSPQQKAQQQLSQKIALEGELARLQQSLPKREDITVSPGRRYQTRQTTEWAYQTEAIKKKIRDAQSQLDIFNKQTEAQSQLEAQQGQSGANQIEASPWYQFQADLLNRSQDRAFAARGLTGSGFEAEERRRGLIELGAGETERQFGRLKGMYDVGANAAATGAGTITGAATAIGNNQVGLGQSQAQGIMGVGQAKANTAVGIGNSVQGAIGAGLNYMQFQNLINANKTGPPTPTGLRVE